MRSDWEDVKVKAMRLTLLAKSRAAHIVEESVHAAWWGAKPVGRDRLGMPRSMIHTRSERPYCFSIFSTKPASVVLSEVLPGITS